jgi:hypothetical protein
MQLHYVYDLKCCDVDFELRERVSSGRLTVRCCDLMSG